MKRFVLVAVMAMMMAGIAASAEARGYYGHGHYGGGGVRFGIGFYPSFWLPPLVYSSPEVVYVPRERVIVRESDKDCRVVERLYYEGDRVVKKEVRKECRDKDFQDDDDE